MVVVEVVDVVVVVVDVVTVVEVVVVVAGAVVVVVSMTVVVVVAGIVVVVAFGTVVVVDVVSSTAMAGKESRTKIIIGKTNFAYFMAKPLIILLLCVSQPLLIFKPVRKSLDSESRAVADMRLENDIADMRRKVRENGDIGFRRAAERKERSRRDEINPATGCDKQLTVS